MRSPKLAELPPPPPGKIGWPWTIETPGLPPARQDGSPWPRISIVTPSYNQGKFIEETIRSVLLQGYPDLEYVVIDGGSTDDSVDIIKKYAPWLTYWVSEKDKGHGHGINKGFDRTSGRILGWINSDDLYFWDSLRHVGLAAGTDRRQFFYGDTIVKYPGQRTVQYFVANPVRRRFLTIGGIIYQHSSFWTDDLHQPLREDLICGVDSELWFRLIPAAERLTYINYPLGIMNNYPDTKSNDPNLTDVWTRDNETIGRVHNLKRTGLSRYALYHNWPIHYADYRLSRFVATRYRANRSNMEKFVSYQKMLGAV